MTRLQSILSFFCFVALFTCKGKEIDTPEAYLAWLKNPVNGLCIQKAVNEIEFEVTYLPSEYLAILENRNSSVAKSIDSLITSRQHSSVTFLMHISPIAKEGRDIVRLGVGSLEEFKTRFLELNFSVGPVVSLQVDEEEFPVALTSLENTYNLRPGRSINIVFAIPLTKIIQARKSEIDLRFIDQIFQTGIHHFVFDRDDLINVPPIN